MRTINLNQHEYELMVEALRALIVSRKERSQRAELLRLIAKLDDHF